MEKLEIEPESNKKITIYLIEQSKFSSQFNKIETLYEFIENNEINFITVDVNDENFKNFKHSNISRVLDALNIKYYLLDMPEFAYSYLYEEINSKEEQVVGLLEEYQTMDDKGSLKGLNLKSWIDVLEKEVIEEKNNLELKTKPKWIVKKILDLVKKYQKKDINILHFAYERTLTEIIDLLKEIQIEVIVYDFINLNKILYLTIKEGENI